MTNPLQRSYVLVNRELLSELASEVAGLTGEKVTRKNQRPIMEDVVNEDGEVVGSKRVGWELYDEEVDDVAGGYSLVGRNYDDTYSGVILTSPDFERLRSLADQYPGSYVELYTEVVDGESSLDAAFAGSPSLDNAMAEIVKRNKRHSRSTPVGKLNQVIRQPEIGGQTISGSTNRDMIEGLFGQFEPGWKIGKDNI